MYKCAFILLFISYFKAVIKRQGPEISPGYFHRKIKRKYNQNKSPAVWFPAYFWDLPGNLKS